MNDYKFCLRNRITFVFQKVKFIFRNKLIDTFLNINSYVFERNVILKINMIMICYLEMISYILNKISIF